MCRPWWVVLGLLMVACPPPKSDTSWQKEFAESDRILAGNGPEAALQYLTDLPGHLSGGQRASYKAEYRRLLAIAKLEDALGRWDQADQHLQQCLRLSKGQHDANRTSVVELTRFTLLCTLRRFDEAGQALDTVKEYARSSHSASLNSFILHDTGLLLEKTGHFEEAVDPLKQSLGLFEKAADRGNTANVRISLAWAYHQMGHLDLASEEYLAAQREALPGDRHLCLGLLGTIAFERREFLKAATYYHEAAEAARKVDQDYLTTWLADEATTRIELHDWQAAAKRNDESLAAGSKLPNVLSRELASVNQARIAAGTHDAALALRELQAFIPGAKEPERIVDAYGELARIYQAMGDSVRARTAYEAGLKVIDQQATQLKDLENKLSFQASAMRLNQAYIAGLMAHGRDEEAFQTAEASRARMLRDSLSLPARAIESRAVNTYRQQAKLANSAYLAYWIAPERSFLWVTTEAGLKSYTLPGEDELHDRVEQFQQAVQDRKDSASAGAALFRTLVQPAAAQLRGLPNVVIVPDGPLYGLNFETLRQGSATAPYWIDQVTVSIAPSLSMMLSAEAERSKSSRVLLIGDAAEWDSSFPRLLNAPEELGYIEAQFTPPMRTKLSDAKATPAGYEHEASQDYRYIHFATHAAASRNAPLESAIILSKEGGRGKLTARDLLRTPIRAELVSISACRSAGSRTYAGEGLVGLAWAFLRSGAHSVVAGLWDVSDFSSPLIMRGLYDGLAHGKGAPEALRSAKLELLKPGSKYAEPYYWGPFLLYCGAGYRHADQAK